MSTIKFIKNMIMRFFQFMYIEDEDQIDVDGDAELSFSGVLKSMTEIAICIGVCFVIFIIPIYLKLI